MKRCDKIPIPASKWRILLFGPAFVLGSGLAGAGTGASEQIISASGQAWPAFGAYVDSKVREVMGAEKLPGMTVAVTKDGRLILSKGYGYANTQTKTRMQPYHRSRIGSVSKAVITGPATYKLMTGRNIDPSAKKLYGQGGLFGVSFDSDITIGVMRHTPIAAIGISPEDKVYAWYRNGTFSVGSSNDLDRYQAPKPFSLPPGMKSSSIRDIDFAKNGRVYVWYDTGREGVEGKRSIGTPDDLDKYSGLSDQIKLPGGKTMHHVVGIGIAKSDDQVYAWYDDGTVSSGTSMDFSASFAPKVFTCAPSSYPWGIRGMAIAKNDRVYAWFFNGFASTGMSTKLDRYQSPYRYTMASGVDTPDWMQWYRQITPQDLLLHKSGFTGGGDSDGAAALFNVTEDKLAYEHIHRHYLRQRKLRYEPGTTGGMSRSDRYSNHGFGLCTLIVKKLTGKDYWPYVCDAYLRPLGLQDDVLPERIEPDSRDAYNHTFNSKGDPVPAKFEKYGLGLAAGGFRSSAENLTRLTKALIQFEPADLERRGWETRTDGIAGHSGATGYGGTSYVRMYPKGYKDAFGVDQGRLHIALVTNIRTDSSNLRELANKIAAVYAASSVSSTFDLWK